MRRAALALLMLAGGCMSRTEAAYQRAVDCFAFFYAVPANSGSPEAVAARAAYRERAIAQARATGRDPAIVESSAQGQHASLQELLNGMGAHEAEEVQKEKHAVCVAGLRR